PEPVAEEEVPPVEPVPASLDEAVEAPSAPEKVLPPAAQPASSLDDNRLPISWSVQLASLPSRASAEKLQQTLRSGGYNAYIRHCDGMDRVFVGPVIERAEADRLRDQLNRQHNLK